MAQGDGHVQVGRFPGDDAGGVALRLFRVLPKVLRGEFSKSELDAMHETYDIHFSDSPLWENHRG